MESHRLTKIICTLGPASSSEEQIRSLAEAGMNVARINLSHGTKDEHVELIRRIRSVNENMPIPIGILLDTKGAEIRTGDVQTPLKVSKGDELLFVPESDKRAGEPGVIAVNYDGFAEDVKETERILIDNGELSFDIIGTGEHGGIKARAREDGKIGSRRHVNLPGADIDLPSITEKDWQDIAFAAEQTVDFIALSFIRTADEVEQVRSFLQKQNVSISLVSKIETSKAVENIAEIIQASDGIMVARGDLGAEVPFELLPAIQDEIVIRCNDAGKPVIVATHMLESMTDHPIPTRAEMTDVAHAAKQQTDATMLSGETATGRHPPVAVDAMHRILSATEEYVSKFMVSDDDTRLSDDSYDARSQAAVNLARTTDATAILVFTRSGRTAQQISKFRPNVPIVACTNSPEVQRKMTLLYGVFPVVVEFSDPETTIARGMEIIRASGFANKGDRLILVSDVPKELADWSIQQRTV